MLRRMWQWFTTPKAWVPRPKCPLCGREIVSNLPMWVKGSGRWSGYAPSEHDALIARCPVHGRGKRGRRRRLSH